MTHNFHINLNRMALFTAFVFIGLFLFHQQFLKIATSNIYLNGIIIGTTLFGICLCFIEMFRLLPEYKWLHSYKRGQRNIKLPPRTLHSVALLLHSKSKQISASALNNMLNMIIIRFEDSRESIRYITNVLVFLGLFGTFFGLIITIGGFAELINNLNFQDETILESMQAGLSKPLGGMATAFTSSLLGLGGSLVIGFLSLQLQIAQNAIFHELEDYLAAHTSVATSDIQHLILGKHLNNIADIETIIKNLNDKIQK